MKSIFAGMMIGLGGLLYLKIGGILGAVLFSVGLLGILSQKQKLYTGMAGDEVSLRLLLTLLGNILGTLILAVITIFCFPDVSSEQIVNGRIEFWDTFGKGILCGILMSLAVRGYRKGVYWIPLIAVPAFILGGFSHCIADSYYYFVAKDPHWLPWLGSILGNLIGCNIPYKRWVEDLK